MQPRNTNKNLIQCTAICHLTRCPGEPPPPRKYQFPIPAAEKLFLINTGQKLHGAKSIRNIKTLESRLLNREKRIHPRIVITRRGRAYGGERINLAPK